MQHYRTYLFLIAVIVSCIATVNGADDMMLSSAYGGGGGGGGGGGSGSYGGSSSYSAPAPAAPSYGGGSSYGAAPAKSKPSYSAPAPAAIPAPPCPKNYIISCQPALSPVACSAPSSGGYGSAAAYSQYVPAYVLPPYGFGY